MSSPNAVVSTTIPSRLIPLNSVILGRATAAPTALVERLYESMVNETSDGPIRGMLSPP